MMMIIMTFFVTPLDIDTGAWRLCPLFTLCFWLGESCVSLSKRPWSRTNSNFQYSGAGGFGLGAAGYGLRVESDLATGSTAPSATFGGPAAEQVRRRVLTHLVGQYMYITACAPVRELTVCSRGSTCSDTFWHLFCAQQGNLLDGGHAEAKFTISDLHVVGFS